MSRADAESAGHGDGTGAIVADPSTEPGGPAPHGAEAP